MVAVPEPPVMQSVRQGVDAVRAAVLAHDIDGRDGTGRTALHIAANERRLDVLEVLLAARADAGAQNCAGHTPIFFAVGADWVDGITALLAAGASTNSVTSYGLSPLMLAAGRAAPGGVRMLLQAYADPRLASDIGLTALSFAADKGHEREVFRLVDDAGRQLGWRPKTQALPRYPGFIRAY